MPAAPKDMQTTIAQLQAELNREHGKLAALREVGQSLARTFDWDTLVQELLTQVTRILEAEKATLFVLDEDANALHSRLMVGGQPMDIRLSLGQGLAGWVAQTGRSLNVKDAYRDVRFDGEWDRLTGFRTTSALCVPVKDHRGSIMGVLQVLNRHQSYFSLEDETMLAALAAQAAISLENSKLFLSVLDKNMELLETKDRLEQKVRELDVLFEIAQVSASAVEPEDLLEGVLARAMRAVGAEAGSILLGEEESGDLHFCCAVGGDPERLKRVTVHPGQGICGYVAQHKEPLVVNDVNKDPRHSQAIADSVGYHPHSVLCVPLALDDGSGALELLNKGQGKAAFTDDDLKLASMIAGHVSTAIKLSRARREREHEHRLAVIGQLLSGVVHDLRGPMTVIKGYTQLLRSEEDEAQRTQYTDAVLRQLETVNAMTGEVLAFARGQSNLLVRKVYLAAFLKDVAEQLRAELDGRPIKVELELDDRGTAYFDEQKVRRALYNLARNAAQAIGNEPGRIVLAVARGEEGELRISCTDNGPGVPAEIRGRVFESFATHGKPEGTGLGLAIVRKVALDHGGQVEMNSQPGHTVFTLAIPQQPRGVDGQSIAPPPSQVDA